VKIQPQWVVTPGKQTTNNYLILFMTLYCMCTDTNKHLSHTTLCCYKTNHSYMFRLTRSQLQVVHSETVRLSLHIIVYILKKVFTAETCSCGFVLRIKSCTAELRLSGRWLSGSPIIRVSLARSGKFVENSTKLTCLEITGYRIKCSTVLWLIELQIRRGREV
jgi:hypothetical protein